MRIIHTSDWHLGRSLCGMPLLPAQASFADWLVEFVRAERVDAVLISHLHHDHLDVPSLRQLGLDKRLIVPNGAGALLRLSLIHI